MKTLISFDNKKMKIENYVLRQLNSTEEKIFKETSNIDVMYDFK